MRDRNPAKANAALGSAYLTREWDDWLSLSRLESTNVANHTGVVIAGALALWLGFITAHRSKEEAA